MAWIFNLIALLNFTTTCQCHFWSIISVDGLTSQVVCTWMIQMSLNGVSQRQKIGHLMGHYMIPHHVSHIFSLETTITFEPNYPIKLKFELDLYFMVLNKCRKSFNTFIWKPSGDGQTDGRTLNCRIFRRPSHNTPPLVWWGIKSKTWTSVTILKGYPFYVHISLVGS